MYIGIWQAEVQLLPNTEWLFTKLFLKFLTNLNCDMFNNCRRPTTRCQYSISISI